MVALDTVVGGTAVRYRAAGYAGTWLDETAEPRCEGGIGIWRRVGNGRAGEQYHRGKEEWPHHPRRRLSEGAHAIHDLRPGRRDARLEQPAAMPKALRRLCKKALCNRALCKKPLCKNTAGQTPVVLRPFRSETPRTACLRLRR